MDGSVNVSCPRCRGSVSLVPVVYEERGVKAEAMRCPKCEGHFFGQQELAAISQVPVPDKIALERIPDALEQLRDIGCPGCGAEGPMLKAQSRRERRVTLDVCAACGGIWLDGGELEAIRGHAASLFGAAREWLRS